MSEGSKIMAAADHIEREAVALLKDGASDELVALASIAISLKALRDTHDSVIDFRFDFPAIRTREAE